MEKNINKYTIHTDGGSRGNPGSAAIGVVIEGSATGKKMQHIGIATNNEAECQAVIFGLKKIKQLIGSDHCAQAEIIFYMDSELLERQLNNEYKVKEEKMQKLFMEVHNLRMDFKKVEFRHILRGKNEDADRLVNQALDIEENKLKL